MTKREQDLYNTLSSLVSDDLLIYCLNEYHDERIEVAQELKNAFNSLVDAYLVNYQDEDEEL